MKIIAICAAALALGSTPAWAFQSAPSTTQTPADRAAMQRELADLRQRMGELAQRMGKLSSKLALDSPNAMVYRYLADANRGLLGVVIQSDPQANGYKVTALTPNGAAQQAGIKVGDVITRINGKPVDTNQGVGPFTDFKAGTTVKLRLSHDGKTSTVSVTPRRRTAGWPNVIVGDALVRDLSTSTANAASIAKLENRLRIGHANSTLARLMANGDRYAVLGMHFTPWWGLNMAPLNADLAGYFGTQQGALVLSTQPKRYPGIKAGDVITAVNGKPVQKPVEVMRALSGQLPGMTVNLEVHRHGKNVTVKMRVPKAESRASAPVTYVFGTNTPTTHTATSTAASHP